MSKTLFLLVFFICFGITTEVFFTAIYDTVRLWPDAGTKLEGHTYIWMAPIYALIPLLFPWAIKWMADWPMLARSLVYMVGIFLIEFVAGWMLDALTGQCPWDYTGSSPYEVMGYIRLDYAPAWMVFGIVVEKFYSYIANKVGD